MLSGNNLMQEIFIWVLLEQCCMRSRQCHSLWFPNTERLCQCMKSLWNVLWKANGISETFLPVTLETGPSALAPQGTVPRCHLKSVGAHPAGLPASLPCPSSDVLKSSLSTGCPHEWMRFQTCFCGAVGRPCAQRGQTGILFWKASNPACSVAQRAGGLSCRRCVYRWKCRCCFFLFFWKKLSSISSSGTVREFPEPERQPSSNVDAHQKWHRPGWKWHWEPRGESWAVRWYRESWGGN